MTVQKDVQTEQNMLWPQTIWFDDPDYMRQVSGYDLLKDISWPDNGYFHLHSKWHGIDHPGRPHLLPPGYDYYVLSWHGEYIDHDWIESQNITVPVIILHDWNYYSPGRLPENFIHVRWMYWHRILDKMIGWFGTNYQKNITHKVSAFCNRITQSKMWITTAILETLDPQDRMVSLSDWLEEKNVHYWSKTNNAILDELQDKFQQQYLGKLIKIDDFTNNKNFQLFTANPDQPAYQNCALHFTNESWHYSLMHNSNKQYIFSGPNFSEKTLKCLLGATAFIPVGQFDVYRTLTELGMQFDYGLDLSFDQDPGNLSRAEKIIGLIKDLKNYTAHELFDMTRASSLHNQQHIVSGDFFRICETKNQATVSDLQKLLDSI
jgi:hypothetical protein